MKWYEFVINIAAIIELWVGIKSLRLTQKTIDDSIRPQISVTLENINVGQPISYLIIKNTGNYQAKIVDIETNIDLSKHFSIDDPRLHFFDELKDSTISCGESKFIEVKYDQIESYIKLKIIYSYRNKVDAFEYYGNMKFSSNYPSTKITEGTNEQKLTQNILQEILQRVLLK